MRFSTDTTDLKSWADLLTSQLISLLDSVQQPEDLIDTCGEVFYFAGTLLPADTLECNGQLVLKTAYAELYAVIGAFYNTGGELTTQFRIPNLLAKTPLGLFPLIRTTGKRGKRAASTGRGTL